MYNYYREPWLVDRLGATMQAAFGHAPCVDVVSEAGQQAVITAGLTTADAAVRRRRGRARPRTPRRRPPTTGPSST